MTVDICLVCRNLFHFSPLFYLWHIYISLSLCHLLYLSICLLPSLLWFCNLCIQTCNLFTLCRPSSYQSRYRPRFDFESLAEMYAYAVYIYIYCQEELCVCKKTEENNTRIEKRELAVRSGTNEKRESETSLKEKLRQSR